MAYLALSPVSVAVFTALNVAGLTALATGGVHDDVPRNPSFPFVWYEVRERELGRMGGGGFPEVELRVHVFSSYQGAKEPQAIGAKVVELLRDQSISISGYNQAGKIFYDETQLLTDELIAGVKVRELVSFFRIYAEEA